METKSIGAAKYFLLFVDDASRMAFVYFFKEKNQVLLFFKEFLSMVKNKLETKLKVLEQIMEENIAHTRWKYSWRHQVLSIRKLIHILQNKMVFAIGSIGLVERAKCLLFEADLNKIFWAKAVNTAVYLKSRSPASGLGDVTPFEEWTGNKPGLSHVRVFGSPVMVHVPKIKRQKWDKKAVKSILIGYPENTKGYRLYNPETIKVTTSRDVTIMEKKEKDTEMAKIVVQEGNKEQDQQSDQEETVEINDTVLDKNDLTYTYDTSSSSLTSDDSYHTLYGEENDSAADGVPIVSSKRVRKPVERYGVTNLCVVDELGTCDEEITYEEAMNGAETEMWRQAMKEELKAFEENQAWEVVTDKEADRVFQCKRAFKRKFESDNKVRYRARLVAKGFTQVEGVDYKETYSPVLRHSTLRMLFA